jgi:hypothetical protein
MRAPAPGLGARRRGAKDPLMHQTVRINRGVWKGYDALQCGVHRTLAHC